MDYERFIKEKGIVLEEYKKVLVNCENYREKRRETLTALAHRLAEKAHRTCRKIELEPMNPFERRVIHSALVDSEIAETVSEGEDINRHVVIIPKGVELKGDRRRNNRNGNNNKNRSRKDGDTPKPKREKKEINYDDIPDGKVYSLLSSDDAPRSYQCYRTDFSSGLQGV